jgi:glycerol kinase
VSHLVIDVGTSGVRAAIVRPDASVEHVTYREVLPSSPLPNFVEFDASVMASAALECARATLDAAGGAGAVTSVGIANQRASTIVWDRSTGAPVGPGVGWQDLRTVGTCLALRSEGIRVAPNTSATKLAFLLDMADPARERDLCFGTVDSWIVWHLTEGAAHVTDLSNAAVTDLLRRDGSAWDLDGVVSALRIPPSVLPSIVDSTGFVAPATALPGAPMIAGLAGDQQASLIGQGCVTPGLAKITFGTGGMLDVCVGPSRPSFETRGPSGGCFPIVAWRDGGSAVWGVEAVMLAAGSNVEWLRDDLGLIATAAESAAVAAACSDTGDVWYVPALMGLGSPVWDFGARGTLVGLTRGSGRAEVVRAVLEGVAHRGADLVAAAEADTGLSLSSDGGGALRVDGGMTANEVFVQALADACGRPVEVSPVVEATTLGAAFLAGLASGTWASWSDVAATWAPRVAVEPSLSASAAASRRDRWLAARSRAERWIPELSSLDF